MNQITQTRKKKYKIAKFIHFLLQCGPILVFLGLSLINLETPQKAFSFGAFFLMGIILSIVAAVKKKLSHSSLWIILIGFYFVLDYLLPILFVVASCQIADELFCVPILERLKEKYYNGKDVEEYL